jgi:hypothetical protein
LFEIPPRQEGEEGMAVIPPWRKPHKTGKKQSEWVLGESEIFKVAYNHLKSLGWRVVSEPPVYSRSADGGAIKDGVTMVIEAKRTANFKLMHQIMVDRSFADIALAVVGRMPKVDCEPANKIIAAGIGLWVIQGGDVVVLSEPRAGYEPIKNWRDSFKRVCEEQNEDCFGGVPNMSGTGPAQACLKLVREYKLKYPKASWREMFEKIPNHYSNHRSFQGSMSLCEQREART